MGGLEEFKTGEIKDLKDWKSLKMEYRST